MRRFTTLKTEFAAIFQKKMMLAALITIMFVPVLYAGTYLYAFKDPYGKLKDLPVAVVNLDKGATHDGKELTVGKDFVKKLKEKEDFQWHFVSDKEANKGLADNKYYMVIRIPENFSENATTLMDDHPKRLVMDYIPNKGYNFLASQISSSAVEKIKEEISSTITETYAEDMFDSVKKVSDGFVKASDGAHQINDGQTTAKDGSQKITNGLGQFTNPNDQFQTGLGQLNNGSKEIAGGLQVLGGKSGEFQTGLGQLNNGSKQISDGLQILGGKSGEFQTGIGQLNNGSKQISDGLNLFASKSADSKDKMGQLLDGSKQVTNGLGQMLDQKKDFQVGLNTIEKGAKDLKDNLANSDPNHPNALAGIQGISKGATGVTQGLEELNKQAEKLPEPYKSQFQAAVKQLIAGNQKVESGTKQMEGSIKGLAAGAGQLEQGVNQLAAKSTEGLQKLHDGSQKVTDGVNLAYGKLDEQIAGVNQLAAGSQQVTNGLNAAYSGSGQLINGVNQLAAGSQQVTNGLNTAYNGSGQLIDGVNKLATGAGQLNTGLGDLTKQATDGLNQLHKGSIDLTDGLVKLQDGSKELADQLHDGAVDTGKVKGDNDKYTMFAKPVKVNTEDFGKVDNYGTGVAPYFLSLGLYVGALLLSVIYPLRESAGIPKSGVNWFLSKYTVLVIVGLVQSVVIDCVVLYGLDFKVQSVPQFLLFTIVTSIAFLSLIQFLVTTLGDVGRFIAIIILVLQLTTSAGTYPIEMVNNALQMFSPLVPMTYSVAGFKAVFATGDYTFMWHNGFYLIGLTILCALGTTMCLTVLYKRYFGRVAKETSAKA